MGRWSISIGRLILNMEILCYGTFQLIKVYIHSFICPYMSQLEFTAIKHRPMYLATNVSEYAFNADIRYQVVA